jgi:hypothetical protein
MSPHSSLVRGTVAALAVLALAALPSGAGAHVERPSYWPDPAADTSITPAAGGEVPKMRSLSSTLNDKAPGTTRVVCQPNSLLLVQRSIAKARKSGYDVRPTDHRNYSAKQGRLLLRINRALKKRCRYSEIQPAVTASGNNDRVVIMPGLYTEPTARAKPTHDEACKDLRTDGDRPGDPGVAVSYAYQAACPNDQNLIAVIGREPGTTPPPKPPRMDRHGIPDLGKCIRCNVQIEGSGVNADDVVIDAGDVSKGNKGPSGVGAKKDVVIRADRADGFVLRRVTVRHAGEHGIYVIESDGYVLDSFKAYYNKLYGVLSFVEDHGVMQNCEAVGHGDSGVYPGGAVETGDQRPNGVKFRLNQVVQRCDLHHNMAGFSGTNGNAIHVRDNNFYDNALGLTTDVVTGAGHPGFPGDSMLIEENRFYSNNFNPYEPSSDVVAAFPFPVGTGMWIAGGNHHIVRDNYFYDNWRRGTMLFSVPDALICGSGNNGNQQAGCDETKVSTSHYNQQYENHMGVTPGGKDDPNGTDFWWDPLTGSKGNCWYRNGPHKITTSPAGGLPDCDDGKDPASSVGAGNPAQTAELLSCLTAFETRQFSSDSPCPWLKTPPEPGAQSRAAVYSSPFSARVASNTTPVPPLENVPLGAVSCAHWNAVDDAGRAAIVQRLGEFAGGSVVDGERELGHGATMTSDQATANFAGWCARPYAQGFLLYRLYTYGAAFSRMG